MAIAAATLVIALIVLLALLAVRAGLRAAFPPKSPRDRGRDE